MKYDQELIGFINFFENLTHARVKDAFVDKDERVVFVVNEGEMGKAIGKKGSNIKKASVLLKKKIRIIEFSSDAVKFVKNAIYPIIAESVNKEGEEIIIKDKETSKKALLIGRDQRNLKALQELVGKYFKESVKVV